MAERRADAFYQFWLNQADEQVEEFLRIYTELGPEEVAAVMAEPGVRAAQKRLAFEVTKTVHGEETAKKLDQVSAALYGGEGSVLDPKTAAEFFPMVGSGDVLDVLAQGGLSRGEAKRLIEQGGVSLRADDGDFVKVSFGQKLPADVILKIGKNKFLVTR